MQSMYKQKALNSFYLKTGPHTDTHTHKWTPMVFIEVLQLEERELETRACTWTCPPRVVFDDPARRDSNPQHDATPSTRDGGKASDASTAKPVLYEGRSTFGGAWSHVGELYFMTRSLGVLVSTGAR